MYHITEDSSFIVSSEIIQGLIYAKEQHKFLVIKPATVELFGKFAPGNSRLHASTPLYRSSSVFSSVYFSW